MTKVGIIQLTEDESAGHYTFRVDVGNTQFVEETNKQWIQALTIGKYRHPSFGIIDITLDRIRRFASNWRRNVRGQDLDIDFEHKIRRDDAAGWVVDVEAREKDGLWYLVEWTNEAATAIREKKYRYFSAEFADKWTDPTGTMFTDVLTGGALTNRPFLKGMQPITLAEQDNLSGGNLMNRKALEALATKNGIEFDESTSDADLQAKVEEAVSADDFLTESEDDGDSTNEDDESLDENELATLSESNPVIARLVTQLAESNQRMRVLEKSTRLADTNLRLSELKGSNDAVLSPKARTQLSDLMISLPAGAADRILKFAETMLSDSGVVVLSELGGGKPSNLDLGGKTATETFNEAVTKLTEGESGMSYKDATIKISTENRQLWDAMQAEEMEEV